MVFLLVLACITPQRRVRAQSHSELAAAYLVEGDTASCIQTAQGATKLDRKNADAWHTLALCTMQRGANEEAEKAFKRALRLTPDEAGLLLNYAYLLQNLGRTEEAIEHLEHARDDLIYREPAKVLNNLGWAYLQVDRDEEAVAVLEEAVIRQPNFCGAIYNLGLAYSEIDEHDLAIERLAQVQMQCSGMFPEAPLLQGMLLVELGRNEEAAGFFHLVIEQYPGTPEAQEAERQLDAVGMN